MLLGLDIGSTALKAALIEPRGGRVLAQCGRRLPLRTSPEGTREQDPPSILRALASAVRELRRTVERPWHTLSGLGLAVQGGSTLLAEPGSGRPLTPIILWNDTRASVQFQALQAARPARWWRARTLRDEPGMGLAHLAWLRQHQPQLLDPPPLCLGLGPFLFHQLTGQWRQDACDALQAGCYDTRSDSLTRWSLNGWGLPLKSYAPIRQGHATHPLSTEASRMLGLPAGIPVSGPYSDHEAGYLSVQSVSERPLQGSLGTAWVGNFLLPPGVCGRAPVQFSIPSPGGPGRLIIMPLLTGNVTWDWALRTFLHTPNLRKALSRSEEVFGDRILPPAGLMAIPWLNRPNPLVPGSTGAACFHGASPSTSTDDLLRALAAGMVLEFFRVLRAPLESGTIDSLVVGGGAAHGVQFQALFAAACGSLPGFRLVDPDLTGARGCLHAFSARASSAPVVPLPLVGADLRSGLALKQSHYGQLLQSVCGQVRAGTPFTIDPPSHPPP